MISPQADLSNLAEHFAKLTTIAEREGMPVRVLDMRNGFDDPTCSAEPFRDGECIQAHLRREDPELDALERRATDPWVRAWSAWSMRLDAIWSDAAMGYSRRALPARRSGRERVERELEGQGKRRAAKNAHARGKNSSGKPWPSAFPIITSAS